MKSRRMSRRALSNITTLPAVRSSASASRFARRISTCRSERRSLPHRRDLHPLERQLASLHKTPIDLTMLCRSVHRTYVVARPSRLIYLRKNGVAPTSSESLRISA